MNKHMVVSALTAASELTVEVVRTCWIAIWPGCRAEQSVSSREQVTGSVGQKKEKEESMFRWQELARPAKQLNKR